MIIVMILLFVLGMGLARVGSSRRGYNPFLTRVGWIAIGLSGLLFLLHVLNVVCAPTGSEN
jgi:hypothetical protein